MDIKLSMCNNIETGTLTLKEGALNIKYAINGTGKSTIAQAISSAVKKDVNELKTLIPYKYLANSGDYTPSVTGIDSIKQIMTFNENYVEQYIYQPNEVIKNSFEIFVKTPKYDIHMKEIKTLLNEINIAFNKHPELDELITNFNMFIESFGKTKSGYSATSPIGKGFGKGNKISHIPKGLEVYAPYLTHTNDSMNVKWIQWQINGKPYLDLAEQCPYCSSAITANKETILKVEQEFNAKSIEHLNKILKVFEMLLPYFDEETKKNIKDIFDNASGITKQQRQYLAEVKNQAKNFYEQLLTLKGLGFHSLKQAEKVADELKGYIINLSLFTHFNSEKTRDKVDVINASLSKVLEKAGQLQGELNKQKKHIKETIEQHNNAINEFFLCAGYNYEVFIDEDDNHDYHMLLKPINLDVKIDSVKRHLSYGERNAFALALFMFDSLSKNPDLIILDDPISSFDGNKKFALINMLFLSKTCFKDRTVLLLTHEFNTVIDIIHTMPYNFHPTPNAYFLTTKNGVLTEIEIKKSDICSFKQIAMENIQKSIETLNKLIYLRRFLEFENNSNNGEKGSAWNLLSNLFHKREIPIISDRNMTSEEIKEANDEIRKYVTEFDYSAEYKKVCSKEQLIHIYHQTNSNYEKLQIYRIFHDGERYDNLVVKKFVNEVFHVENDYLFQLNPKRYDTVPQYIIDECDKDINITENELQK